MSSDPAEISAISNAFTSHWRMFGLYPGAELHEEDGVLWYRSPIRHLPYNAVIQTRVADVTETVERADNALKVTDDVYLARVYGAALELFRATAWRRGIERKLEIFRETYAMLNGEAQAARSELLEVVIIVVILAELFIR